MWTEHHRPLPDLDAIRAVIDAVHATPGSTPADTMDLGAALMVMAAARLDLDRLEVELVEAVREAGLEWAAIAAVLGLPNAATAERRYAKLANRREASVDEVRQPRLRPAGPKL